jgi:hypothetical protein
MDDKQAEAEIEAFLEAATDGAAPAEGPATQPVTTENAPTKQAGDKSKPKSTAAPRMRLWTLMAEAMLGVLEAVLVRLDGPVAKIRPEIKALIGYCAVVTLAMGIVAWTIALLR